MIPTGPDMRLYRRLAFGNLIDFSVLDTRQYRSNQAVKGGPARLRRASDPARTMLGEAQERWLFDNLADARARWTMLGQQVPMFARHSGTNDADTFGDRQVAGISGGARSAVRRLMDTKAPNPVVLSGDVHVALWRRPRSAISRGPSRHRRCRVHRIRPSHPEATAPRCRATGTGQPGQPAPQVPQRPRAATSPALPRRRR